MRQPGLLRGEAPHLRARASCCAEALLQVAHALQMLQQECTEEMMADVKKFNCANIFNVRKYEPAVEWLGSALSTAVACTKCTASVCQKAGNPAGRDHNL